jgi:O-succinylbenzoate synthase
MAFKIHPFELKHRHFPHKKGVLLEGTNGNWSEVSPLPGRSSETLNEAIDQLTAILSQGYCGPYFPSVAFGLYGLTAPFIPHVPCALLLAGTPSDVLKMIEEPHGCTYVKLKVGTWSVAQALRVIPFLSDRFFLRIDFNHAWEPSAVHKLCAHLNPKKIEFLEDPGCDIAPFHTRHDTYPSSATIWKPMVRGLPPVKAPVILSSAFETSIGLQHIASLLSHCDIPEHVLGLGTGMYRENDVVSNPAFLKDGKLHFPKRWEFASDL